MIRYLRDFRLVPIVLAAVGALFVLKTTGIITAGGYTLGAGHLARSDRLALEAANAAANERLRASPPTQQARVEEPAAPRRSWAQDVFNYPDVTGSVGAAKPDAKSEAKPAAQTAAKPATKPADGKADPKAVAAKEPGKPADPKPSPGGAVIPLEPKPVSSAERAILERLTERRLELDERERELQVRETLLQAQEKKIEDKVRELKDLEARIAAATKKKEEVELSRLKGLVTMYENMKAKDAAKIFERLDIKLATEVATQIAPRRMSDIMAQMSPEAAERLTVELANRSVTSGKVPPPPELPKIEGRPGGG